MAAKRILVTGGHGCIGSALIRLLLNADKLTYAPNLASIPGAEENSRYRFVKADIADAPAMRKALVQETLHFIAVAALLERRNQLLGLRTR